MRRMLLLGGLLFALSINGLSAQTVPDSLEGSRVRIHLSRQQRSLEGVVERQMLRGELLRVNADSVFLTIHPQADPVGIAMNGVHQIDVSRDVSRGRTAVRRGLMGAAVWAGLGAMGDEEFGGGPTENALIWAAGGLVVGSILGAVWPEEGWSRAFRR